MSDLILLYFCIGLAKGLMGAFNVYYVFKNDKFEDDEQRTSFEVFLNGEIIPRPIGSFIVALLVCIMFILSVIFWPLFIGKKKNA